MCSNWCSQEQNKAPESSIYDGQAQLDRTVSSETEDIDYKVGILMLRKDLDLTVQLPYNTPIESTKKVILPPAADAAYLSNKTSPSGNAEIAPKLIDWGPRQGSGGSMVSILLSLLDEPFPSLKFGIGIGFCIRGLTVDDVIPVGNTYEYTLKVDTPRWERTSWTATQVPLNIYILDESTLRRTALWLGHFSYTDTTAPQPAMDIPRKRRLDEAFETAPPLKRTAMAIQDTSNTATIAQDTSAQHQFAISGSANHELVSDSPSQDWDSARAQPPSQQQQSSLSTMLPSTASSVGMPSLLPPPAFNISFSPEVAPSLESNALIRPAEALEDIASLPSGPEEQELVDPSNVSDPVPQSSLFASRRELHLVSVIQRQSRYGDKPAQWDVLDFLRQAKKEIQSVHPTVYNQFLDIIENLDGGSLSTINGKKRVSNLLRFHLRLLRNFDDLLPQEYKILTGYDRLLGETATDFYGCLERWSLPFEPHIRSELRQIMQDYIEFRLTAIQIMCLVPALLISDPPLIWQFNAFLPPGAIIETLSRDEVLILKPYVTTSLGSDDLLEILEKWRGGKDWGDIILQKMLFSNRNQHEFNVHTDS